LNTTRNHLKEVGQYGTTKWDWIWYEDKIIII